MVCTRFREKAREPTPAMPLSTNVVVFCIMQLLGSAAMQIDSRNANDIGNFMQLDEKAVHATVPYCLDANWIQLDEKEVHDRGSYCLAGGIPGFWYQRALNSSKWLIVIQGGGWSRLKMSAQHAPKHSQL